MSKLLPATLLLGGVAILAFAFTLPTPLNTQVAAVGTTTTPSVSFTQEEVQTKEGSTVYLRVKLDQPITRTTKVTIKFNPEPGTAQRDVPSTKILTYYPNGLTTKTLALPTSRTTAQADRGFTATITKVGNTTIQGDTARILVKDQRSTTVLANNQNTNNQNTNNQNTTTTNNTPPPANCAQYSGVIPGKTQKYSVQTRGFAQMVLNPAYGWSAEAQRELASMQDGSGVDMGRNEMRMGNQQFTRLDIPTGVVLSYKFKTSEYNHPFYHNIGGTNHPDSGEAYIIWSVSECPADFTSPGMLTNPNISNPGAQFSNISGPCVSVGSQVGSGVVFGHEAGTCRLQPNKTYYMNIAVYELLKSGAGGGVSIDVVDSPNIFKPTFVINENWFDIVKNKSAYYTERRRVNIEAAASARTAGFKGPVFTWK